MALNHLFGLILTALAQVSGSPAALSVTVRDTVGLELDLGLVIDAAVRSDGAVYVADRASHQVLLVSEDGKLRQRIGREGDGPGEFRSLYRVAAGPGDTLFAYDLSSRRLSRFTPGGRFIGSTQVPYFFPQLDRILILAGGRIAIAGVASWAGFAQDSAVHIFTSEMEHVRSFGPLPSSDRREVLQYWGAGGLSLTSSGELLYSVRLPYAIYRYRPDGHLRGLVTVTQQYSYTVDDAVQVVEQPDKTLAIRRQDSLVTRPTAAYEVRPGLLLAGRVSGTTKLVDLVSSDGHLLGTAPYPNGATSLLAVDLSRRVIWFSGDIDDVPVLLRAKYAVDLRPSRSRNSSGDKP